MASINKRYNPDDLDGSLRLQHRFLVLRKLGQGTYGKVQLALNKETNEEVAVKTIKKGKIENEEDMLRIRREIHIMSSLRHPHIIHINEVFETRQKIVIAMQYASGGELYDYLGCHQTLPEDEARRIFRQIASAIYYCHKNQICHRDLKLENILLDEEGNAKIADFGLSNIFDDKRRMNTFCGSPLYASPEIVKGTPYKGPEVDCWSLGVLLYTLVYGTMPFDGRSFKELVSQISEGRYEEPINRSSASSLIRWLLTPEIPRRATITDVCKDSWVNHGYDTSLLEVAESMALSSGLPREQITATKLCLETNTKNGREKSIFRKAAAQIEEKAEKFTSLFTKNVENILKTNDTIPQTRKNSIYEQITNYDVRFVLNKLLAAVEASLNAEKNSKCNTSTIRNAQKREEAKAEKVDSAYVIPIFEVTSTIPSVGKESSRVFNKNSEKTKAISRIPQKYVLSSTSDKEGFRQNDQKHHISEKDCKNVQDSFENSNSSAKMDGKSNLLSTDSHPRTNILTDSQKQYHSLNVLGESDPHKTDSQTKKLQNDHQNAAPPSLKSRRLNSLPDRLPCGHKPPGPFVKTKNHVLTLARLLSLNYEKVMRNSFRVPAGKKKLPVPGKITIPPTFDPNNPPTSTKKQQEEKKELLIFPTVSVSENKVKIEKKIEKIKKAALDKNFIIRSDSKTRMRIEKYIRSQVKRIQDLVCEEQRSLHASLEHLDEQSLRDMSEMYYCAFGSENTDSGIANTEDDEYFCFLCSKPNGVKGTSHLVDSVLESIKKGCLYTSNHLHIPRGREQYSSNNSNLEFGSLSRCKSEIEFPTEYLNYISSKNYKLDSNKRNYKQQIQRNSVGNTNYFLTTPFRAKDNSNLRILRSASDSVGLNLSKNTFEVVKLLNTDDHDDVIQNYRIFPHFLEQTSNGCNYSQMTDFETQSSATDATFNNTSQMLEKDDGIGDSNDSFQSYIEALENNAGNDASISRSVSSHNYRNFANYSTNGQRSSAKLSTFHSKNKYENGFEQEQDEQGAIIGDILDSAWMATLNSENGILQQADKSRGLRRRNTVTCIRDKSETNEDLKYDENRTEFESYLWNAYKEHLLENNHSDTEYSSSPNLNYYSLDRKKILQGRDCKSMDYINGENSNDFISTNIKNLDTSLEQDSNVGSSKLLKNILRHSTTSKTLPGRSGSHLNRTKSTCSETLTDSDREIIRKLREGSKLSVGNMTYDTSNRSQSQFSSNFLKDLEQGRKVDSNSNRRRFSKTNLPHSKRSKSEYKKSFLQLLALKRIQEAEKELDKTHRNDLANLEEENSGSLLEALKTHGYKNVISQRFQDTDDDSLDPYHMKYLKSPRNLRAELARLNYMYYDSLPMYTLDPYEETGYLYDDVNYSGNMLNGFAAPSIYDMQTDFRKQTKKQSVRDWLDTTQIDEYLSSKRRDPMYIPEETTPTDMRRCCTQWGKESYRSFDDESTSESQDTIEEFPSNGTFAGSLKNKEQYSSNEVGSSTNSERFQTSAASDDERESVHDRIWRKSFYSRFNNRALSRKERSSFLEPELSESRLGLLNNVYNPSKTGSEISQWDGSNKSFLRKSRSKKHSPSFDKLASRSSIKKKYIKPENENESVLESCSNTTEVCNTAFESEEPEH